MTTLVNFKVHLRLQNGSYGCRQKIMRETTNAAEVTCKVCRRHPEYLVALSRSSARNTA